MEPLSGVADRVKSEATITSGHPMKINRLALLNFRACHRLDIKFEADCTVIVGDNGSGKTSILDAIAQLLGYLLQRLPGVKGLGPRPGDLRLMDAEKLAAAMHVYGEFEIRAEVLALGKADQLVSRMEASRILLRDKSRATKTEFGNELQKMPMANMAQLVQLANALIDAANAGAPYKLPLFAYYGTSRAVFETPMRRRNFKNQFARFDSLNGALDSRTNFKRVFEWFHTKENEEAREQKQQRSFEYQDPELAVVRRAIEQFFPQFTAPRTELRPLRFVLDQQLTTGNTITLDLNQLSDGYRTTLALVVDLACRMVEGNPPQGDEDPLCSEAIVLIDEIDLHLHPRWQQTILPDLRRVFPNTQFIVTTHSAPVLSTVEPRCIRMLESDQGEMHVVVPDFSLGAKSNQLLEEIQGVNARPNLPITQKLARYRQLVEADEWDSPPALELRTELDAWGAQRETELARIDIDIKMRALRRSRR